MALLLISPIKLNVQIKKLEGVNLGETSNFFLIFLPAVAIYLGALSVVRSDVSKIEKKINSLEKEIIELKNAIQSKD